jgi:hypothetical protein
MTGVDHNNPQLLNPHARSSVKLTSMTARDGGITSGGQQIIDEHSQRPIDYPPLRGADILKEPRVSHRQVAPREPHESGCAIEAVGSDRATARRSSRIASSGTCHVGVKLQAYRTIGPLVTADRRDPCPQRPDRASLFDARAYGTASCVPARS